MSKPTFLIVGAMKAGTTTLYRLLAQHPEIYMSPVKEPNFYAYRGGRPERAYPPGLPYPVWTIDSPEVARQAMERAVDAATFTTLTAYQELWKDAPQREKGEASVLYLYLPHVAESIAELNPDVKLIVVLRNPVDRAYSHFLMARRMGREPIASFVEAMEAEAARIAQNYDPFWHYRSFGYYHEQLERYYNVFKKSQILILLNEDLKNNLSNEYSGVLRFLGVDTTFKPSPKQEYGVGGIPRSTWLYRLATSTSFGPSWLKSVIPQQFHSTIMKKLVLSKPKLDSEVRADLTNSYRSDILGLEKLIDKDLHLWKC